MHSYVIWLIAVIPSENENDLIWEKDRTPIVVIIPGLTSDSDAAVSYKIATVRPTYM